MPPAPPPRTRPETTTERRDRQVAYFARAADLAMEAAELAAQRLRQAHAADQPHPVTAAANLDLNRAIRSLSTAVDAENRVIAEQPPLRAPASDPRRAILREALVDTVRAEPDPAVRATLLRDAAECIEDALIRDPDAQTGVYAHLRAIADALHLTIVPARLSDAALGMPPRKYVRDDGPVDDPDYHPNPH